MIIKIYKTKITPDRNALVDSLNDYLSSLSPTYTNDNFQFVQIEPKISIKINVSQEFVGKTIGNYVELYERDTILGVDGKHFYYFVTKARWKSKETIELELGLDTINTFKDDFTFNKKTSIVREHKDRFKTIISKEEVQVSTTTTSFTGTFYVSTPNNAETIENFNVDYTIRYGGGSVVINGWTFDKATHRIEIRYGGGGSGTIVFNVTYLYTYKTIKRHIDFMSEGITTQLYGKEKQLLTGDGLDWYLIWKSSKGTAESDGVVSAKIIANERIDVAKPSGADWNGVWDISYTDLQEGYYYWIDMMPDGPWESNGVEMRSWLPTQPRRKITTTTISSTILPARNTIASNEDGVCSCIYRQGTNIFIRASIYGRQLYGKFYFNKYQTSDFNNIGPSLNLTCKDKVIMYKGIIDPNTTTRKTMIYGTESNPTTKVKNGTITYTPEYAHAYYQYDNSQEELIKIIKLPYCPSGYSKVTLSGTECFKFDIDYDIDTDLDGVKLVKFRNLKRTESPFRRNIIDEIDNPLTLVCENVSFAPNMTDLRNDDNETKIKHSDFYQERFVYDSFSFPFQLELVNQESEQPEFLPVDYIVSSVISSKFMFSFPTYILDKQESDYPNQLIVDRNNEMPIYSNAYLNYLRTGYNYDVKNKNISNAAGWIGTGVGIATTIGGIALAATGYGAGVGAGLIVSGVATIATSLTSSIASTAKAENAMEQKKTQLRAQGTSVSQCDDIDLTSIYTQNKAKIMEYEVSDQMKKLLLDTFYYCGYINNEQKIPNLTSRIWFNFISCNPVFNEELETPYQEYLDDIKSRYALGVTNYHKNIINGVATWDWEQEKENWETSMFY